MTKTKRFDPHQYAATLAKANDVASDRMLLYVWTGTHWQARHDGDSERDAYHWIVHNDREHATPANARAAYRAAILWAPPLPTPGEEVIIPCRNGYVHCAEAGTELRPAERQFGLQHVIACEYLPSAQAPRFTNFLHEVLPDPDVRGRVQEYVGYTLTSDARYQRAQLWIGGGANGKGVLANIVQALHGTTAAVRLDALEGFLLSTLIGASLIYADEVPRGRMNEQLLKSMIAGERVQVDRKYQDPLSINIRGKWLALGNHMPTIADHSMGFWRRWDVVPFDVTTSLERQDPLLAQRIIKSELAGVLVWALDGLVRLQERGAFAPQLPAAMARLLETVKAETNSVIAWFDDVDAKTETDNHTEKDAVYRHYQSWCSDNGLRALDGPLFWRRLRDICAVTEERKRVQGRQIRVCNVSIATALYPEP